MALLFSNKVARSSLQPGDHIYCYRKLYKYSHHGIYVEEDRVIHYNRTQEAKDSAGHRGNRCNNCGHHSGMAVGVVKTCVDCFTKGQGLRRFRYGVSPVHFFTNYSGTCTTGCSDSAEESISRATDLLSNKGFDKNLFENNCESFAIYCKTHKHISNQAFSAKCAVDRLLNDLLTHDPQHKYTIWKETLENPVGWTFSQIAATLGKRSTNEGGNDAQSSGS